MNSNQTNNEHVSTGPKTIAKDVLANKTPEERCELMNAIEEKRQFPETEIALNYSYTLLNIFEYINVTNFTIDLMMLNKFWQCVAENRCTAIIIYNLSGL